MWLCQLLFLQSSPTTEAIRYQKEQSDSRQRFLPTLPRNKASKTAQFCILPDHNARATSEEEFALSIEASNILLYVAFQWSRTYFTRALLVCMVLFIPVIWPEKASFTNRNSMFAAVRDGHHCCNCIIYLEIRRASWGMILQSPLRLLHPILHCQLQWL